MAKRKSSERRKKQPAKGRRFTAEQKHNALVLVASRVTKAKVAEAIGTTEQSVLRWQKSAERNGTMPAVPAPVPLENKPPKAAPPGASSPPAGITPVLSPPGSPYRPKDPGQGLSEAEEEAILEWKKKHPSMGPAQIRTQLKRFKGWRISTRAVARVLKKHGYEPVHLHGRPQGPEPIRFEAPRRNFLWQLDYTEVRVGADKRQLLLIIDDYSRFLVGHKLCEGPDGQVAVELMQQAVARHGKPEAVRTDRGSGFICAEFDNYLECELIDHMVGRAYHPQGGGKVESVIGTLKRERWETEHFDDWARAEHRLGQWVQSYNEKRAHMGLDGLTPADRFFGRAERVLEAVNALSRRRNGFHALYAQPGSALEEIGGPGSGAPAEVLRLVVQDGQMELRLCGCRVKLGPVEN
jgi:putative transposase